jgi:hypothetical protein
MNNLELTRIPNTEIKTASKKQKLGDAKIWRVTQIFSSLYFFFTRDIFSIIRDRNCKVRQNNLSHVLARLLDFF